jgi:hypothetical protein
VVDGRDAAVRARERTEPHVAPHGGRDETPYREDVRLPVEGRLPSFGGATGWLNSEPLTPASLEPGVGAFAFKFGQAATLPGEDDWGFSSGIEGGALRR